VRTLFASLLLIAAVSSPQHAADVRPTMLPWDAPLRELWQRPAEIEDQNLFDGPWDRGEAPDQSGEYVLVSRPLAGAAPQLLVADESGREWAIERTVPVRQGYGSIEVVLSRVLSALGYHQPPVYFVRSFTVRDSRGLHEEPGGRFRRQGGAMLPRGGWSWEQNPFVDMRPYQGLLVVLLMFNASQIDNANNTLYDVVRGDEAVRWYVVRDLAATLGPSGLAAGLDVESFARGRFVTGVARGFAQFDYAGSHQVLVRDRITPDDVGWTSFLLDRLSEGQWQEAFRAGGYEPRIAAGFITALRDRVALGRRIGGDDWP